ncbi:DUF177 domain-containing protein [Allopusillimonas soli]|uniref:Large ribosomal RNA subunit accumulation protein YceD n=1 Tax=Allopusillimonas soli TaxID=659016 RepID=A0A853FF62_9BURK|nr:YceD family protein [Allopusillimonas soli]NYT38318.1 DUF177 domain-containing protein [Allopusillimonas soli]TEA72111.1 DUF177 domain-containing protein [Allopusillimonas soli]
MQFVDSLELVRLGQGISGQTPLSQFVRLLDGLPAQPQPDSPVTWSVRGSASGDAAGEHERWLHVRAHAAPTLVCQRCMQPFVCTLEADTSLQLVASEAELEALDARDEASGLDDQDMVERIVASRRLDVLALVEDELILSLPYVPKHDVCPSLPDALKADGGGDSRPSPFAVLEKLKKH